MQPAASSMQMHKANWKLKFMQGKIWAGIRNRSLQSQDTALQLLAASPLATYAPQFPPKCNLVTRICNRDYKTKLVNSQNQERVQVL